MGLAEEIKEIKVLLEDTKEDRKDKKFRIPFGKKVGASQKRKNYVTLVKINENRQMDIKKVQIKNQTILEDKIPRLASAGYVLYFKKNPWIILPSWSVEPFSPTKSVLKTQTDGSNITGFPLLLERMESEATKPTKQVSGIVKWIAGLFLLGIIAYAFITGGG